MRFPKDIPVKLFVLILCFSGSILNAQKEFNYSEFRVSDADLTKTFYEKDSSANALVIYEYGKSFVTGGDFDIVTNIKKKIKIFNRKGFDKGTVKLYLYKSDKDFEKVSNIEAITYFKNSDGKVEISKLDKKNIFKEEYSDRYKLLKFTLPNLKEGAVVTISYRLVSPFVFNFYEWNFQEDIPKLYSEYNTKIPGNYTYNIKLVGWQKLDVNDQKLERDCVSYGTASADCVVAKYVMKNIDAFTAEKHMTTAENYMSKLEYELMTVKYFDGAERNYTKTWQAVDREIRSTLSLGRAIRKTKHLKDLIPESVLFKLKGVDRAKRIFEFVQNNYTRDDDDHVFSEISTKQLVKEKRGCVTEINVLLNSLLELNGFKSNLVLLSTRKNGLPTKLFPVISEFNYSIVCVEINGYEYLLDASNDYLSFGQIPFKCLNSYGRKLDFENGSSWVPIESKEKSASLHYVQLQVGDDNALKGTIKTRYTGYHAYNKKRDYYSNKENYLGDLEKHFVNVSIDEYEFLGKGIKDNMFQEIIYFHTEKLDEEGGLFFDPFIDKFFTTNPFKLKNRTYPVDFGYKDSFDYILVFDAGEAYEIKEIPKNIRMMLEENKGEFSMISTLSGSKLRMLFKIKFHEAVYPPYFYDSLKELMKNVVDKQMNSIVLLKKK